VTHPLTKPPIYLLYFDIFNATFYDLGCYTLAALLLRSYGEHLSCYTRNPQPNA